MSKHKSNKQLTDLDRLQIEVLLNQGYSPAEIARQLGRDPSGIRKEILRFGSWLEGSRRKCARCLHYLDCTMHYMCPTLKNRSICSSCRHCSDAAIVCPNYKVSSNCTLLKKRHICNGCENLLSCIVTYRYIAKNAISQHRSLMNFTHRDLKIDSFPDQFLQYVGTLIKNEISPDIILHRLPSQFKPYQISTPTLYEYIDQHLIPGVNNMDLRMKITRAAKGHSMSPRSRKPSTHQLNGHSIEDLPEEEKNFPTGYAEIDTVVGIAGSAVLFTILFPKYSLMLTRKLNKKTQEEVKRVLDELESSLGKDFYLLFRTVVPDNGTEFTDSSLLEQSAVSENMSRFHVYYTHSYFSWEKPHVENMHILLRWLVSKGADIALLTEADIESIILTLNNYPRPSKGYKTPIELLEEDLGKDISAKLGLKKIPLEELLVHYILKKKKNGISQNGISQL